MIYYFVTHWGTNLSVSDGGGDNWHFFAKYNHGQDWELFTVTEDNKVKSYKHGTHIGNVKHLGNGLCAIMRDGRYVSVESNGDVVLRDHCQSWEHFRMRSLPDGNHQFGWHDDAHVRINIYRFFFGTLDHSGIVVNGTEYYYDDDSRVKTCKPGRWKCGKKQFGLFDNGTLEHELEVKFHGNGERAQHLLDRVRHEWLLGREYNLYNHNCNLFVKAVCKALQVKYPDDKYFISRG